MIRQLLTTASMSGASALTSRGVLFAGVLIFAYRLGPAEYGQFTLIQTTALLFTTFCALSLGQMATKIVAEAKVLSEERVEVAFSVSYGSALIVSLLFAILILASSKFLAIRVGNSSDLTVVYAASSLLVLTGFLVSIQNGIALALNKVKEQALANLLGAPIALLVMVLASLRNDLGWAMYGYIGAQIVFALGQERVLRRYRVENRIKLKFRGINRKDWAVLWQLGLPSSIAGLLTVPAMWFSMVLLSRGPNGALELGHFALGNQTRTMLLFGIGVIANAVLPMLSSASASGRTDEKNAVLRQSILLLVIGAASLAVITSVLAPFLIPKLAPAYTDSIRPLQLLLLSVVATAPTTILMRKATADNRPGILVVGNIVYSATLLGAAVFLLRTQEGASGLALAHVLASLAQLAIFVAFNHKSLRRGLLAEGS